MEMTRKKQYENQVTHLALDHTLVIVLNPLVILQYLIITNMVQHRYLQLYSNGQGGLSTLAAEVFKTLQFTHVALEPVQEMTPELV